MTSFGSTLLEVASATVLLSLPILVYRGVSNLLHHAAAPEVHQVPIIAILSRLSGFLWAGLALAGGLGEQAFRLSEIFLPDSVWAIPAGTFLLRQGNLWSYDMVDIVRWSLTGDDPTPAVVALAMIASAAGAAMLSLRLFRRPQHRVQALALSMVTVVMFAWQSVYLVALAMWLIHRANFWSLAIIALYIQYRRSRHH